MAQNEQEFTRIDQMKEKIKIFLDEIYLGEHTYNLIYTKLINAVKVFIVASRKFVKDDCPTKASSIAYTTIISLIPTLTVALTFFSVFYGVGDKKDELFRRITLFMIEHNIKLNIDPFIQTITSLIENAGKIGGVGAVVLIFSATAVLRTLEKSLNDIWKVKKSRSIFMKIIFYWAALTLGPLMLIAGTTVATKISTAFSAPQYFAMSHSNNNHWVVETRPPSCTTTGIILNSQCLNRKLSISTTRGYSHMIPMKKISNPKNIESNNLNIKDQPFVISSLLIIMDGLLGKVE